MIFLLEGDFDNKLDESVKAQITGGSGEPFDLAEKTAMATVTDSLSELYNLTTEYAKTGTDRHPILVKWLVSIAMYDLYERIPDNQLPKRVVKNYDDTLKTIEKIEQGKKTCTLTKITDPITGNPKTVFRWGSEKRRTH